jgi:hypothetical protein
MLTVPVDVAKRYETMLERLEIASNHREYYKKWFRYFLDFSDKYPSDNDNAELLRQFLDKLRQKNQSALQCQQAAHAVSIYFEMQHTSPMERVNGNNGEASAYELPIVALPASPKQISSRYSQYREAGYQEKSDSPEWDAVLETMAAEIKVRHYSRKTLITYAKWSRVFNDF